MEVEMRDMESELVYGEEMMRRQGKEDLARQRRISAAILWSYLAQNWIQEYKGLVLIPELLYS